MLKDCSFKELLDKTTSSDPVPGGGSVSAFAASFAAALTAMVAGLTAGKKGYEPVWAEMQKIQEEIGPMAETFADKADEDADAFARVMTAFKLPKDSAENQQMRKQAISDSFQHAALVPLGVAQSASKLFPAIEEVISKGNSNAVTDAAVAALMTRSAILGALYNVKINLSSIKDEAFVAKVEAEVTKLEAEAKTAEENILSKVNL